VNQKPLLIDLRGAGEISLYGKNLPMPNKKARTILSMLALAPKFSLTRSLIKSRLWGDRSDTQAAASLRQALTTLRKYLTDISDILTITQEYVGLDAELVQIQLPLAQQTLLPGIDIKDQGFEDWLRQERANHELNPPDTVANEDRRAGFQLNDSIDNRHSSLIKIGILPCLTAAQTQQSTVVGDVVSDIIAQELRNFGIAETYDYRHNIITTENGSAQTPQGVDFFLQIAIHVADEFYVISCKFFDSLDNKQLWNGFCKTKMNAGYLESDDFRLFVNEIMDVTLFIFSSPGFTSQHIKRSSSKLALAAINEILKGRHGNLKQAEIFLDQAYSNNNNSVYLGWKTHIAAYQIGERLVDNPEEHRKQLREVVANAEEQGRFNPVTLALIAHTHSFVFHDYAKATEIYDRMFQLNPMQAICFDLSAVTNVYINNKELAYQQSQLALKLGRFSPYRYCIDTTCTMASAINKRYEESVRHGERATSKQPTFTAALRFLTAAKSLSGDIEGAEESYRKLTQLEPDFSLSSLQDKNYPVAGTGETANLLKAGLSKLRLPEIS